jgi:probable H4MPT-linked C1 transfer pathway protein
MVPASPHVLGFDIGGANIKVASDRGQAAAMVFPLWKNPQGLAEALRVLTAKFAPADYYVVTMTGELADCFYDRGEGVREIVHQSLAALGSDTTFYSLDGRFLSGAEAIADDRLVAAANWHALASLAAKWCRGEGLLIDIGSTTSDFIPLCDGRVATDSRTDYDRLVRGELVYAGIGRTPICALVEGLPFLGQLVPIMNEVFATTDDCALLMGLVEEEPGNTDTCDGRGRTLGDAGNRMARMIGLDHRQVTLEDAKIMSAYVIERLRAQLAVSTQVLSSPGATWVLTGHGVHLLSPPHDRVCLDLGSILGAELSRVAPAYAVARLALAEFAALDVLPVLS